MVVPRKVGCTCGWLVEGEWDARGTGQAEQPAAGREPAPTGPPPPLPSSPCTPCCLNRGSNPATSSGASCSDSRWLVLHRGGRVCAIACAWGVWALHRPPAHTHAHAACCACCSSRQPRTGWGGAPPPASTPRATAPAAPPARAAGPAGSARPGRLQDRVGTGNRREGTRVQVPPVPVTHYPCPHQWQWPLHQRHTGPHTHQARTAPHRTPHPGCCARARPRTLASEAWCQSGTAPPARPPEPRCRPARSATARQRRPAARPAAGRAGRGKQGRVGLGAAVASGSGIGQP